MREVETPRPLTWRVRLLSFAITSLVNLICATLRLRVQGEAETLALAERSGGAILVSWHGRTFVPLNHFRGRGYWVLVSLSRDGDIQTRNFARMGFRIVRGSTGRRGVAATREVLAALQDGGLLAFTPDGPRGPSGKVQPGVAYFAQRSKRPVIPIGIAASSAWRLSTWDSYLIPRPFAKVSWRYGDPIFVAEGDSLDEACVRIGAAIDELQALAGRDVGAA